MTREEAINKGLDETEKRKLEESLYKPLDDFLKRLKKKIKTIFAPLFVSGFDELHIIRLTKITAEMYSELDEFNRKNYEELVKHARKWAEGVLKQAQSKADRETGKMIRNLSKDDVRHFVNQYLKGYDPVTQYVYTKEVDRKRMRLNEAVMTAREFQDIGKLQKAVKKAADLWFTQSSQYALDLMIEEIKQAYEEDDITLKRWNTQRDEKVCKECGDLDGKVFDSEDYPKPPHYGCRCYPTPVLNE